MVVLVNKQWLMYQRQAFGRQKRGSSRWQAFKDGLPKLKNWQWLWRWWWWWWQACWWWQWWQCVGVPRWQAFKDGLPKLTDWCKTLNPRSPPLNMDASTKSNFCLKFPWFVHQKNVQQRYWKCDDRKICGNLVKYVDPELRMCDDGDWWKIKSFHLLLPPYVSINSIAPWVPLCWGTLQHT